ncbi:MAG: hypothetical protein R3194_02190 [Limnobacter sp.]|nr:hypothetical protein [Limnobacter sp.]
MTFLSVLFALFLEALIPHRLMSGWRRSMQRISDELLVDFEALGAPSLSWLHWWLPTLIWVLVCGVFYSWLSGFSTLLSVLFSLAVLCVGLRYSSVVQTLTSLQLYLNQGDLFRSRETLLNWLKAYGLPLPVLKTERDVIIRAMEHGVERSLRQFFSLLFWFVLVPGPVMVAFYLAVWWSVWRERAWHQTHEMPTDKPTLHQVWRADKRKAYLSPRFALYLLEWIPARLLALALMPKLGWAEAMESWKAAGTHSPMSNRARLVSLLHKALGLEETDALGPDKLAEFRKWISQAALIWLAGIGLLSLIGSL